MLRDSGVPQPICANLDTNDVRAIDVATTLRASDSFRCVSHSFTGHLKKGFLFSFKKKCEALMSVL